jgi:hypothetical protein
MSTNVQVNPMTDQIRKLESAETTAFFKNDFATLNEIWHPGFRVNTPLNRILGAADIQEAMKAGFIQYSLLERNIEEILVHDNVVITLGNEVTLPIDNAPMAGRRVKRRYTNIWVRENNEWRLFSRHASNICDEIPDI